MKKILSLLSAPFVVSPIIASSPLLTSYTIEGGESAKSMSAESN